MNLTPREQELLDLIREFPLSTPEELARRLGSSRSAVNVHVSNLVKKGALRGRGYIVSPPEEGGYAVVVGGANMDFKSCTLEAAIAGTSNPGLTSQAAGGVGRNIAENLARLGVKVHLISAVGQDSLGQLLLRDTEAAGVNVRGVTAYDGEATGTYSAVLDASGELLIAVADMRVMERLTPATLESKRALLAGAAWIVADGNLPAPTLQALLERSTGQQVIYEPVSVPKATHLLAALQAGLAPYAVTPNLAELGALVGREISDQVPAIRAATLELHAQGIAVVWVRRGKSGSLLSQPEDWHELPALPAQVVDVTGAGDSMLATFIAALIAQQELVTAAHWGHAAAALTVESALTVVPDLSLARVKARASEAQR